MTVQVAAGTTVLFYDPSNTLVARVVADQFGAKAYLPTGGAVTIVAPLRTIFGVQPGDVLVETDLPYTPPGSAGSITVKTTADQGYIAGDIRGTGFVAQGGLPVTQASLDADYVSPSDVIAIESASLGDPFRIIVAHGQTLAVGGTVDLTSYTWQPMVPYSVSLTGASPDIGSAEAEIRYSAGRWDLFKTDPSYALFTLTGGAGSASLDSPGLLGDRLETKFYLVSNFDTPSGMVVRDQYYIARSAPTGTSASLDLTTSGLSWLKSASFTSDGVVSWTTEHGAVVPDAIELELREGSSPNTTSWSVVAPGDLATVTLPPLPSDLVNAWSSAPGLKREVHQGSMWKTSDPDGFRILRSQAYPFTHQLADDDVTLTAELQAATGSIAISTFLVGN